ncbi:glycosyltransferase [Agarivorans sp. JK6]|uniref:glycosyltransferase n=1 Tax=Agarivorans sp. JK6 TaxID=2997426 RepID=UPI003872DA70
MVVIAPNDDSYSKQKLERLGVFVYGLPNMLGLRSRVWCIAKMNSLVLRERLNGSIFVCHFLVTFLSVFFSLTPFNSRAVVYTEGLGSMFSNSKLLQSIVKLLLTKNQLTRLFCNKSERHLIGLEGDEVTGGIGVDVSVFPPKPQVCDVVHYELLYIGRLIKDKGVNDAIDVLRFLLNVDIKVKLNLVGDIYPGNPSSLTEAQIQALNVEFGESINFVGFTEDVLSWYTRCHVLLLPSKREGFPVCVMEANSVGLPCVGYNVPGVSDAIVNNVNGLLAEYGDTSQLSKITQSLLNVGELNRYRCTSRNYAVEHFDIEPKTQRLVTLVNDL